MTRHPLLGPLTASALLLPASLAVAAPYQGTYTQIYAFTGGADGAQPNGPLAADSFHNLYGTAGGGGSGICPTDPSFGCGTIFKLNAQDQFSVLHNFTGSPDGQNPGTGLTRADETLFGTTFSGGANGLGTIFSIGIDGTNYQVLHSFTGNDGYYNITPVLPAPGGGLYGIAAFGGLYYGENRNTHGVVYLLQPGNKMILLHEFTGGADGDEPSTIVEDAAGDLFGSTSYGGSCTTQTKGCGVVFKIDRSTRAYSVIYTFTGGTNGNSPVLGSVDANGVLHGTTLPILYTTPNTGQFFTLTPTAAGYQFAAGTFIHSGVRANYTTSGPAPFEGNALAGALEYGLYAEIQGQAYTYTFPTGTSMVAGPLTIAGGATVYGAAGETIGGQGVLFRFTVTKPNN